MRCDHIFIATGHISWEINTKMEKDRNMDRGSFLREGERESRGAPKDKMGRNIDTNKAQTFLEGSLDLGVSTLMSDLTQSS